MRKVLLAFSLLILSFLAYVVGFISYFHIHELIFPNVRVAGVNLGGLSLSKAKGILENLDKERKLKLIVNGKVEEYSFHKIGLSLDVVGILRSAFGIGRRGWFRSFKEAFLCITRGVELKVDLNFDKGRWGKFIAYLKRRVDKPAVNARPIVEGGKIVGILPAKEGYGIDEKRLLEMLREGNVIASEVQLPMTVLLPRVREEDLAGMELIGEFSTSLAGSSRERLENVRKAVNAIDGTLLEPGEKFSFNERVGPRITERGYKIAPVMVRGELVPGVGGGVCQVSTTLYNAVLLSGLKVLKRAHHARPVKYVLPGRDATVVWGYADLVFSNDKDYPIYIQGEVRGGRLIFRIFGRKDFDEIKVFSDVQREEDGTIIAKTYRVIRRGDEKRTELVSTDIYKPIPKSANLQR